MRLSALLLFVSSIAVGCGAEPEQEIVPGTCVAGRAEACPCPGGGLGVQICQPDGAYTACDCSSPPEVDAGFDDVAQDVLRPPDTHPGDTGVPDDGGLEPDGSVDAGPEEDAGVEPDTSTWDTSVEDATVPPSGTNACGGEMALPHGLGASCGECGDGQWICDGENTLRCLGGRSANVCGGCQPLKHAINDACGPCGQGRWVCGDDGNLLCQGDIDLNECGGCESLEDQRWWDCQIDGNWGYFECAGPNTLHCIGYDAWNPCGGLEQISPNAGMRCGPCSAGSYVCAGPNEVVCTDPDRGQNACGGCAELWAAPGQPCGACDGVWECDGLNGLRCSEPVNLCGSCSVLPGLPGDGCGNDGIVACRGSEASVCLDATVFNACGGVEELEAMPGAACGECLDGFYICAGPEMVVCVDAHQKRNACGGCTELWAEPNTLCADGWDFEHYWLCDDDGEGVSCEGIEDNGCGGNRPLWGTPGESCEICGVAECAANTNVLVCRDGTFSLDYDPKNCGACGRSCAVGEYCDAGECAIDRIIDIDAGSDFTCALGSSGRVWCWGSGNQGRLGQSRPADQWSWDHAHHPVVVEGLIDAVEIATGRATACAVRATGDVVCWGDNGSRAAAVDSAGSVMVPVEVPELKGVRSISGGNLLFCGINEDRRAVCWGANRYGELGRGETSTSGLPPGEVLNLESVVQVVAGRDTNGSPPLRHACALLENGQVWCWGAGANGRLGSGGTANSATPVRVTNLEDVVDIGAAQASTCAARANGEVWCWGSNSNQQLGIGFNSSLFSTPVQAFNITTAARISGAHGAFNCAITTDNALWCWGRGGGYGEVAFETPTGANVPGPIAFHGEGRVVKVAGGLNHSCVLDVDGRVWCSGRWGQGSIRYLGDNQLESRAMDRGLPTPVVFLGDNPAEAGLCRDGIDNDGNGLVDCADPACATDLGAWAPVFVSAIATRSGGNYYEGSCGPSDGREYVYTWTAPQSGSYVMSTEGSEFETVLYVLDTCLAAAADSELACDVDSGHDGRSRLVLEATRGTTYIVVVDSAGTATANRNFVLQITALP